MALAFRGGDGGPLTYGRALCARSCRHTHLSCPPRRRLLLVAGFAFGRQLGCGFFRSVASDSLVMVPQFCAALRLGGTCYARNIVAARFPVLALKNARRYVHQAREDVVHAQLGPGLAVARGVTAA